MKNLKLLFLTIIASVGVALTYFYFEQAVHHAISYVWEDLFNTADRRWLIPVICLPITLFYFAAQHRLDPAAEKHESQGLGNAPKPTVSNYLKVLIIGFLSLLAGASLGPEAILVPSCVLLGSFVGLKLMGKDKKTVQLFGMVGFIALFAAFFDSFFIGLLSVLLIRKQFKITISLQLVILAVVASASTVLTLGLLDSSAYVVLPAYSWHLDIRTLLVLVLLAASGYATTLILGKMHAAVDRVVQPIAGRQWWLRGLVAGIGLSLLYLLGGSLVQFTGNESVVPMFKQAAGLGFWGLVWVLFIKLAAISWSKAGGYRGGLVFPSVFAASVLVAIAQLSSHDLNLIYGLIAAMTGILAADSKAKILL